MNIEVVCFAIGPASNPAGKRFVSINFGIEQDVTRAQATTGMPALWDTRAQLFIPEENWGNLSKKFTVGDQFVLTMTPDNITIKKR